MGTQEELILQAQQAFATAEQCAGEGDWMCYGSAMEQLEQLLEALGQPAP